MTINFSSTTSQTSRTLADIINRYTSKGSGLVWFLSGGSAIDIAIESAALLDHPDKITVTLGDERYGAVGHPDSNWQQLLEKGFPFHLFDTYPVLNGDTADSTAAAFDAFLREHETDIIISLFGMGDDSHTAGILPTSNAFSETGRWVSEYTAHDYHRITINPKYFPHVTEGVLQVFGTKKHSALREFIKNTDDPARKPVQLLKRIPSLTLCTDMEETI